MFVTGKCDVNELIIIRILRNFEETGVESTSLLGSFKALACTQHYKAKLTLTISLCYSHTGIIK
jgi:hypothetical protein